MCQLPARFALFGGRFVYVDVIENGPQLVTVDGKLKKLPSDKSRM